MEVWTVIPCKKNAIILEHKMSLDWISMRIKTMDSWGLRRVPLETLIYRRKVG